MPTQPTASAPQLNVEIPGLVLSDPIAGGGNFSFTFLGEYIVGIFEFSLGLIVVLALIVIVAAGVQYALAGGNAAKIQQATGLIGGAITGVFIAYFAYSILAIINPNLVNFRPLALKIVENEMYAGVPLDIFTETVKLHPGLAQSENVTIVTDTGGEGNAEQLSTAFDELFAEAGGTIKLLREEWEEKCLQFAHALITKAGSPKVTKSNQIHSTLPILKTNNGNHAFAGMTLEQLGNESSLKIGMVIHVKTSFDEKIAYKPKDDFHHWVTYVGRDEDGVARFSHSFAKYHTGKQVDTVLKNWHRRKIDRDMYKKTREWVEANPTHPKQATVTAVHVAF